MFSIRVSGKSSLAVHGVRFKGGRTISRGKCGMPPHRAHFGADLLASKNFFANTHGTKIFREVAEITEKDKKIPAPSNESAGILGAASRNRTGTGLTPGDFKCPIRDDFYVIFR